MLIEGLIPLKDACRYFPERDGKRPHLNTLRRWVAQGAKGKKLQARRVGGVYFTTLAWVEDFLAPSPDIVVPASVADERRAYEASLARLAKRGMNVKAGKGWLPD